MTMIRMAFTTLVGLVLFAASTSAEEPVYEPVPVYVFENTFAEPGKPPKTVTEEHVGVSPFRVKNALVPPQGYTEETSKEEITVGGKKFVAEKSVWTRDPKASYPNHAFASVTLWRSDELKTGVFAIPLSREPDLTVPAGCLRLETGPAAAGEKEASAIKLEWKCEIDFSTAEAAFKGQQYEFSVKKGGDGVKGVLLVSPDIDGGVCGFSGEVTGRKAGTGSQTLKSIRLLAAPAGILAFPDAGFGFAPPDGYAPDKAGEGEVAAFKNPSGATIRIATVDLGGEDFEKWWKARTEKLGTFGRGESYVALAVTGCSFATTETAKSGSVDFWFAHAGKGYRISLSNGEHLRNPETQALVAGWRWVKK